MFLSLDLTADSKWRKRIGKIYPIEFKPGVNVLAGPNGAGKSSTIAALGRWIRGHNDEGLIVKTSGAIYGRYIDMPKDSLKHTGGRLTEGLELLQVMSVYMSHGQSTALLLRGITAEKILKEAETHQASPFLILEEPETGADFGLVSETRVKFIELAQSGIQVILSSHHPAIWTIPNANVIVLGEDPEYVSKTLKAYKEL